MKTRVFAQKEQLQSILSTNSSQLNQIEDKIRKYFVSIKGDQRNNKSLDEILK